MFKSKIIKKCVTFSRLMRRIVIDSMSHFDKYAITDNRREDVYRCIVGLNL